MPESISQKVSLVAQVIEDLSYEPLDYQRFTAELEGIKKTPYYKDNGYFVFTDLLPGDYMLRVWGERFQTQQLPVTIPSGPIVLDPAKSKMEQLLARTVFTQPGDNELIVVAKTVNVPNKRITFDAATISRPINAGVAVVGNGVTTKLTTKLDAGTVTSARFDSVAGVTAQSIVRIIRDRSIRLRFDPYYETPPAATRVVGRVTLLNQAEVALPKVLVNITKINGTAVTVSDVGGARVATVVIGGAKVVLGTERDVQAFTNGKGDYTIYFSRDDVANVTLNATLAGFQTATTTIAVTPRARIRADFQLSKL